MRAARLLILLLLVLLLPSPGAGRDVPFPTEHTIDTNFDGVRSVDAADIDGDGDLDLLAAANAINTVRWWENTAGNGTAWTARNIDTAFANVFWATAADFDGDGDLDVAAASAGSGLAAWWENTAGNVDLAGTGGPAVEWWANSGDGTSWTRHAVAASGGPRTLADGDANVQVAFGSPVTFFVALSFPSFPSGPLVSSLRVTHVTEVP